MKLFLNFIIGNRLKIGVLTAIGVGVVGRGVEVQKMTAQHTNKAKIVFNQLHVCD